MQSSNDQYVAAARIIHWLMAVGFIFMWACGFAMTSLVEDNEALEQFLFGLHISVGVTLLVLLVIRIAIRLRNSIPPSPDGLARWEKIGSHFGHLALYLLPAIVIIIGWAETDFGGHGVEWFGISMPKIFPTMEMLWGIELESATEFLHKWFAYGMLSIAIIHVAAVIKHKYFDGHDVLYRMTFGSGKSTDKK